MVAPEKEEKKKPSKFKEPKVKVMEKGGEYYYLVKTPELTEKEEELIDSIRKIALTGASTEELQFLFLQDKEKELFLEDVQKQLLEKVKTDSLFRSKEQEEAMVRAIEDFLDDVAPYVENYPQVVERIAEIVAGTGKISPLLLDENLEEIMINGVGRPVYVFHREIGMCKTNLIIETEQELLNLVNKIAATARKSIDKDHPLLDARLPDGSRANVTIHPASPLSPTVTIRKFKIQPLSIMDILDYGTMGYELAGFLWVAVEGCAVAPRNIVITGGTGSGKTTTLNVLSAFISSHERVVTVEDTLELNLGEHENWIQMESRPSLTGESELTMDTLLKNSLRMRPDRILVGEVRGEEAETLFVAMDVGHAGCMGTLHANSARETLLRLKSAPMNVPPSLLPLLDLIVVQHRFNWPRKGFIRRITEVSEVSRMGGDALLSDIYVWNRETDKIERTDVPSQVVERLAFSTGTSKNNIMKEIMLRTTILRWMHENKIHEMQDVSKLVQTFYTDRKAFLEKVESDVGEGKGIY